MGILVVIFLALHIVALRIERNHPWFAPARLVVWAALWISVYAYLYDKFGGGWHGFFATQIFIVGCLIIFEILLVLSKRGITPVTASGRLRQTVTQRHPALGPTRQGVMSYNYGLTEPLAARFREISKDAPARCVHFI